MDKLFIRRSIAVFACCGLLFTVGQALAWDATVGPRDCDDQSMIDPPPKAPPGDECQNPPRPADALEVHPPDTGVIYQAIEDLTAEGYELNEGLCSHDQPQDCMPDCGAGLITRRVAQMLEIGVLQKRTGAGCDEHSFDVIVFPDGYIYDILGNVTLPNPTPQWMPICCGRPVEEGGDGTCPERYMYPKPLPPPPKPGTKAPDLDGDGVPDGPDPDGDGDGGDVDDGDDDNGDGNDGGDDGDGDGDDGGDDSGDDGDGTSTPAPDPTPSPPDPAPDAPDF
jgi:hypothetical protein